MNDEQMELEMLMDEMGVEGGYVEEPDTVDVPDDYLTIKLNECYDGDIIKGKPQLTGIIESKYTNDDTGEEETNHRVELGVVNDEEMEVHIIRINLKSGETIQENVHYASKLFRLVKGIMEMKVPGCMQKYNRLRVANLDKVKEQVDALDEICLKVSEESMNNGEICYNTFTVVNPDDH